MHQSDREYIRVLYLHLTALGEEAKLRAATSPSATLQKKLPGVAARPGSPGSQQSAVNARASASAADAVAHRGQRPSPSGQWFNRLLWIVGTAAILFLLMSLSQNPPVTKSSITRRTPPDSSPTPAFASTFLVTKTTVAKNVDATGALQGVASNFQGPITSIVGHIAFEGATIDKDEVDMRLQSSTQAYECHRVAIPYPKGNIWCKWDAVIAGSYKFEVRANGRSLKEHPFSINAGIR